MTTLFISDLHLHHSRPLVSSLFLQFLETKAKNVDALYILGDLFEVWIGDDTDDAHDNQIMSAINNYAEKGIPVYFMRGNRDFFIDKEFARKTQCTLLEDPYPIEL